MTSKPKILPLAVVLLLGVAMGFVRLWVPVGLFESWLWLALAWVALGVCLDLGGAYSFRRHQTTISPFSAASSANLVTTGLYAISRNPMYVGFVCYLIGWGFWLGSAPAMFLSVALVWYLNRFQIAYEEQVLEALFGDAYRAYSAKVRRWL